MSTNKYLYGTRSWSWLWRSRACAVYEWLYAFFDLIFIITVLFFENTTGWLKKQLIKFDEKVLDKLAVKFKMRIVYIEAIFLPRTLTDSKLFNDLMVPELQLLCEFVKKNARQNDVLLEQILELIITKSYPITNTPFSLFEFVWKKARSTYKVRIKALEGMKHTMAGKSEYIKVYALATLTENAHVIEKEMEGVLESLRINHRTIKVHSWRYSV